MKLTFLKGPAKSGKTARCIHQILSYLQEPMGDPLLFIVPEQATLQTEESVFSKIPGNVRLIVSDFSRLSFHLHYLLEQKNITPYSITLSKKNIGNETIPMILQSLIQRHREELMNPLERGSSLLESLAEFIIFLKKNNINPEKFQEIAQNSTSCTFKDISVLYKHYFSWIKEKNIADENVGMDYSMQILNYWYQNYPELTLFKEVWVDGFLDFSPQQLDLLLYLEKVTENMTITFCLDEKDSRNFWKRSEEYYDKLASYLHIPECVFEKIELPHASPEFFPAPLLFLERNWLREQIPPYPSCNEHFQIIPCDNPWSEADYIAQRICNFIPNRGRYKECFVLLRDIKSYKDAFMMAFGKRGIPFYFDEHFSFDHHPLFSLIRGVLALFRPNTEWNFQAFIAILKTGLLPLEEDEADEIENIMLGDVYTGVSFWNQNQNKRITQHPLFEFVRSEIIAPLINFNSKFRTTNSELIQCETFIKALKVLFSDWDIKGKLQEWSASQMNNFRRESVSSDIHSALWKRIIDWMDDIAIAFKGENFLYENWCEIVEIGLRSLSIPTIPPAIDQVIIAGVAHSRTPMEAKFVFVAGLNEGIFPIVESESILLTSDEQKYLQDELQKYNAHRVKLVVPQQEKWWQENYYAYIAFTRASQKLVVTYSVRDITGTQRKPSIYVRRLQELFLNKENENKIVVANIENVDGDITTPKIKKYQANAESIREFFGGSLSVSVSKLETYARCPFRFFMEHVLGLQEREIWKNSSDKSGTLYHLTLEKFHNQTTESGKSWRELLQDSNKTEALLTKVLDESIQEIYLSGNSEIKEEGDKQIFLRDNGIMILRNDAFFVINRYLQQLNFFFTTNHFDPIIAELTYGMGKSGLNWRWNTPLPVPVYFKGKIDRIDICEDPEDQTIWLIVMDYKTGSKPTTFKPKDFEKGIQLQLITYLNFIDDNKEGLLSLIVTKMHKEQTAPTQNDGYDSSKRKLEIKPAGAFYINLRENFSADKPQFIKHQGCHNKEIIKPSILDIRKTKDFLFTREFGDLLTRNKEKINEIVSSILSGNFTPTPDGEPSGNNCKYCPAKSICTSTACK